MSTRILLVDQDEDYTSRLKISLQPRHWTVTVIDSTSVVLAMLPTAKADCIATDLELPGHPGGLIWLSELLQRKPPTTPLMVCAANLDLQTRVSALRMGADTVLGKPLDADMFAANAEALIRNARAQAAAAREADEFASAPPVTVGPLDIRNYEARIDGQPLSLTPTEFRLLFILARRYPHAVSTSSLITAIWGEDKSTAEAWRAALARHKWRLGTEIQPQFRIAAVHGLVHGYRLELDRSYSP